VSLYRPALIALAVLGVACKGAELEDQREAFCSSFGTGATATWGTCTNCTVTNPALVFDRNLDTASAITPNGGATSNTVTLQASATTDIASGAVVGVWLTQPPNLSTWTNSLRTLNNNVEQETLTPQNEVVLSAAGGTGASHYLGLRTTKAFDAVEFTTTNTWPAGQTPVYQVYEICSDGGNA
jgi:hypothetical protein